MCGLVRVGLVITVIPQQYTSPYSQSDTTNMGMDKTG